MRVLLDTNVLVSALLFGGLPRRLLDSAIRGDLDLVSSVGLLDELEDVLQESFEFERGAARMTRTELEAITGLVTPAALPPTSRDPDDDLVLATAIAAHADAIVTADKDLLVLGSIAATPILTPRQFLDRGDLGPS